VGQSVRIGTVALAYHEPRFIVPHLSHIPSWIERKVVLVSERPWQGELDAEPDTTADLAEAAGAEVYTYAWRTEEAQRQAGQEVLSDMDWIIVLDPDEFLTNEGWANLREFLEDATEDAYVCRGQFTYWKSGYTIDPPEDYRQIVAVRPTVAFVDKRVVGTNWGYAPVDVYHMSWARTDAEVLKKVTHYSHANEFDGLKWYNEVWLTDCTTDLHPLTPESLKKAIPANLPPELEKLSLWPK
jgi:hypothetical protein